MKFFFLKSESTDLLVNIAFLYVNFVLMILNCLVLLSRIKMLRKFHGPLITFCLTDFACDISGGLAKALNS